ncbi:hypothetical protein ACN1C3_16250 [Pseudomonas sp. H11T01]|uniref:hypothetical protein n=1 Tax=Pseudomonas sp. H11T01 TaxID=3402749 RepID=UPI003ACC5EB2
MNFQLKSIFENGQMTIKHKGDLAPAERVLERTNMRIHSTSEANAQAFEESIFAVIKSQLPGERGAAGAMHTTPRFKAGWCVAGFGVGG